MPHKRAKRTVREQIRKERGSELAPGKGSLRNEPIPKSAARVLNAQAIRDEWNSKKRKREDESGGNGQGEKRRRTTTGNGNKEKSKNLKAISLTIQPGESIQHFNKRVEDDLRPLVKSAVHASLAVTRNKAKAEKEARTEAKKAKHANGKTKKAQSTEKSQETAHDTSSSPRTDKHASRPKEFQLASSSVPRRLNDIAKAPPEFKKFPRGASSTITGRTEGVLSMSQKLMMDQERTKAIARYRELKADRRQAGDRGDKGLVEDE